MHTPLADQIRPSTLDDVVGQRQLLAAGKPLRRIIESGKIPNMIFYGPSGVGKTTVARIIADSTSMTLHKLNGTSASTADIRDVVAEVGTFSGMNGILLYLDEIQYFNKKQQQLLLEYMENGQITLIASTTENPYFAVYNALISRSTVFEFKPVPPEELERAVARGFRCMEQQLGETIHLSDGVCGWIARGCGGDVRKAMNTVELIVLSGEHTENGIVISDELAQELTQRSNMRYDRDNDQHYDLLSALQKSIRGSDENAALHYTARLLAANDLLSVCRRLLVIAAEDVGLAYPQAIVITKACVIGSIAFLILQKRRGRAFSVKSPSPVSRQMVRRITAFYAERTCRIQQENRLGLPLRKPLPPESLPASKATKGVRGMRCGRRCGNTVFLENKSHCGHQCCEKATLP